MLTDSLSRAARIFFLLRSSLPDIFSPFSATQWQLRGAHANGSQPSQHCDTAKYIFHLNEFTFSASSLACVRSPNRLGYAMELEEMARLWGENGEPTRQTNDIWIQMRCVTRFD